MSHADAFTRDTCDLFAGPQAAKRMARAMGNSVDACKAYLAKRRAMSLDAAIALAARNEDAHALLLARIEAARERNAGKAADLDRDGAAVAREPGPGRVGLAGRDRTAAVRPGQGDAGAVAAAGPTRRSAR